MFVFCLAKKFFFAINSFFKQLIFRIRYYSIERIKGAYGINSYDKSKINDAKLLKNKKIAVYTCIVGKYDTLIDPEYVDEKCDFYVFSDNDINSNVWKRMNIPNKLSSFSNTNKNRYIKLHPNEFFSNYDYTIYVDGNVAIKKDITKFISLISNDVCIASHSHCARDCAYNEARMCLLVGRGSKKDIRLLLNKFKKERFPHHYGLAECTLLFTKIGEKSEDIYSKWWNAFLESETNRDQLVIPYVLWKERIDMKSFCTLGTNLHRSTDFEVLKHV